MWRVWIGELDLRSCRGRATVGLLISAGMLMPWYIAWLIPLAALSSDRRVWFTAIVLTSLGSPRCVSPAVGGPFDPRGVVRAWEGSRGECSTAPASSAAA